MRRPQLSVWMEPTKKKAFRMFCLDRDITMHDVINAFIDEVLAGKHGELIERVRRKKKEQ